MSDAGAILALSALRLRLNRTYLAFQLAIDVAIPVGYALLLAHSTAGSDPDRLATGALLTAATLSVLRMPATALVHERLLGTNEMLAVAGVARIHHLAANALATGYFLLFPLIVLALTSLLLGAPFPASPVYWAVVALFVLALHGCALLLAGTVRSLGGFSLAINLVVLVTTVICPLYYPLARVPASIRGFVALLPGSLAAELCGQASAQDPMAPLAIATLAAWAVALLVAGYATAPWRRPRGT